MIGRRLTYGAAVLAAAALHIAYGQYVTYYILLFLLFLPLLSLLLSLPAILCSRAELSGGADVQRGREANVQLLMTCGFFLPPELYRVRLEKKNLFLDRKGTQIRTRLYGAASCGETFKSDTDRIGTVSYRIRSAYACDYLGLFAIPIRRRGAVALTVLPNAEPPVPVPDLIESSERILKPKPLGFSEEHELRPYREGDAVNLIHWKLTEKTDTPIVREPQEQVRKNVVLSVDVYEDYREQLSATEQLRYLSGLLTENGIPYLLCCGLRTVRIEGEGDFDRFLKSFLSEPLRPERAQPYAVGSDTLVYRIVSKREVRS